MNQDKVLHWGVLGGLGVVIIGIATAYFLGLGGPAGATPKEGTGGLPVIKTLSGFALTNQVGEAVSVTSLKGKPWVANIFFSRCPSFCAQMTQRMRELQDKLPTDSPLRLVSITTDPDFDSPEVLERYAKRSGAREGQWHFLTGSKAEIGRAIQSELLLAVRENPEGERQSELDLFTHSSLIVLVDGESRLRGTYESLGTNQVDTIIADLSRL